MVCILELEVAKTLRLLHVRVHPDLGVSITKAILNTTCACFICIARTLSGCCSYAFTPQLTFLILSLAARLQRFSEIGPYTATPNSDAANEGPPG